jgi:hypothetical protein
VGMLNWVNALNQGASADSVLAGILGSDEYYARCGSTPQGFISKLYSDALGRPPTPAELNFWAGQMYTQDRSQIAAALLTQNPGVWSGYGTATPAPVVTPGVIVTPGVGWYRDWNRDRHWDWDRHYYSRDYGRPYVPHYEHHGEHHGEHHEEHHH